MMNFETDEGVVTGICFTTADAGSWFGNISEAIAYVRGVRGAVKVDPDHLAKEGDIIRCRSFSDGVYVHESDEEGYGIEIDKKRVFIGRADKKVTWCELQTKRSGWSREVTHEADVDATAPSRGDAMFIVEKVRIGEEWMVGKLRFNARQTVVAKRIDELGNSVDETIYFHQSGLFVEPVMDVKIVKRAP